jgi:glycosyltransferase involved in cell wall biosynthesis
MKRSDIVFVDKTLMVFPEGPVGFDGTSYRYSKGERVYLDRLAKTFREVVVVTQVLREGDPYYESVLHSAFESPNLRVVELPRCRKGVGVLAKGVHFGMVFIALARQALAGDLFYLFLPSYPSALAWVWARLLRKPHIVYGADDWVQASPGMFKWPHLLKSRFYRVYCSLNQRMERAIVSTALFAVAAGGQLVEKYKTFGIPAQQTTPRMVISEQDIFPRTDTCGGECIRLINVGSLNHDKAQHLLIEAYAALVPHHPRLRLTIAGSGERMDELAALTHRLGVSDLVEFTGYIENTEKLYDIYRKSDIFVLSSVSEGFPRVLYEAMTLGLPIITTLCGGIGHLIEDGVNGRVVPIGSSSAIGTAVDEVIRDSQLRRMLIVNGTSTMRRLFGSFDHQQIARLYRAHLKLPTP